MKKQKPSSKPKEKQSLKRLFIFTSLCGILCALLAVSVFVFFFVPRDKDMYILTIPNFSELDNGNIPKYPDITVEREWIYSSDTERGEIISQEPYAGARRKLKNGEKYKVKIYISLGEKTEMIPELCGVEEMSAVAALRSIGARVKIVPIYGEDDDGTVVRTSPEPDSEICEGDSVTLFVSRQRADEPISVPDFCGQSLGEAYRKALSLGLYILPEDGDGLESTVISQSIKAGSEVIKGSKISFKTDMSNGKEDQCREE